MEHTVVCYDGTEMILADALTGEYRVRPCTTLAAVNSLDALYIDTGNSCAEIISPGMGTVFATFKEA